MKSTALLIASLALAPLGCSSQADIHDASDADSSESAIKSLQPGELLKLFASKDTSNPQFTHGELAQLGQLAQASRDDFNRRWSGLPLLTKYYQFVYFPKAPMTLAVNQYIQTNLPAQFGADFDIAKVGDAQIARAIRALAFVRFAEARGDTYLLGTDADHTDWDGSPINEFPMPSKRAIADQTELAANAERALSRYLGSIDTTKLDPALQGALPMLQNSLRSLSTGAATSFGYGGMEFNGFNTASAFLVDLMFGGVGNVYDPAGEKFLAQAVSLMLGPDLIRLNKGTWQTAQNYRLPTIASFAPSLYGDPSTNPTAKWLTLLQPMVQQYYQSYRKDPRLNQDGYGSGDDVGAIYPSWSYDANPAVPLDAKFATLADFETQFRTFDSGLLTAYKQDAHAMVAAVLPKLSAANAKKVNDAIDAVTGEGAVTAAVLSALPSTDATTLSHVLTGSGAGTLGMVGGTAVSVDQVKADFIAQVWSPLGAYYRHWQQTSLPHAPVPTGYASWEDFWTKFMDPDAAFTVDVDSDGIFTDSTGLTDYALLTPSTADNLIKIAVHENTHRFQALSGVINTLTGAQVEGQALAQEQAMGRDAVAYIRGTVQSAPGLVAAGQFSTFDRDVEVDTRTFAALATLDPKTSAHAESYIRTTLAAQLGVTDAVKIDTLVFRAFDGAYTLNYPGGFLEQAAQNAAVASAAQVDASLVTPYVLLLSGASPNDPVATIAAKLRAGLGLPPN